MRLQIVQCFYKGSEASVFSIGVKLRRNKTFQIDDHAIVEAISSKLELNAIEIFKVIKIVRVMV